MMLQRECTVSVEDLLGVIDELSAVWIYWYLLWW